MILPEDVEKSEEVVIGDVDAFIHELDIGLLEIAWVRLYERAQRMLAVYEAP